MTDLPISKEIDAIIESHGGWKAELLTQLRAVILAADPAIYEEVKWKMASRPLGLPAWSHDGMLCFAEIWKDNVKLLFPKGARLQDAHKTFNARLKSADIRAIEFHEGDAVDEAALRTLVGEALRLNASRAES